MKCSSLTSATVFTINNDANGVNMNESATGETINSHKQNWAEHRPVNKMPIITNIVSQPT
jgi:hypothetical protein